MEAPAAVVCSVCIANYNGVGLIEECIESVLRQDCEFVVEIIVHDDASSDGSVALLRTRYPNVRLIESEANVGFCVANNRMVQAARGRYLLLLNNDAALLPDALRTLRREAQRLGRPAILGLPQYDAASGVLLDIGSLLDPFFNSLPNHNAQCNDVAMVAGACLWIDASLWYECGGFPEWFGSIAEDLYLCCRARLAGHPVRALGASGYRHRVGASLGGGKVAAGRLSTNVRRRRLSERNKTFVAIVCHPALLLCMLLPLHCLLIHAEGIVIALIKRDRSLWQSIYAPLCSEVWMRRRDLLALRMQTQSRRSVSLFGWLSVFRPVMWKLRMLFRHGMPAIES